MKALKYCAFLAIGLGLIFQAQTRDFMNMKPKVVRESEIESGATNVEAAQNNEQIIKILLGASDGYGGPFRHAQRCICPKGLGRSPSRSPMARRGFLCRERPV